MREPPPPPLIALLGRLGLATAAQLESVEPRIRRLARDLPKFESVWIDALAQARILTPFQAKQLVAGRGDRLRVGPFVLEQPLPGCEYANCFRARRIDSGQAVRLAVAQDAGAGARESLRQLETLASHWKTIESEHTSPITEAGCEGNLLWAASPWLEGRAAAEWLVLRGRFPAEAVLEVARAMSAGLAELEAAGLCHGDLRAASLLLTPSGDVVLPQPGLRGIVRPEEGYAHAELRPEAYQGIAPERVASGTPPCITSDLFSCGCLWWHLLCGRSPLPGGDSLAVLRAAQTGRIEDVRQLAPDVPAVLAKAIDACIERDPRRRPESMTRLAAMLGTRTRAGRLALIRSLSGALRPAAPWIRTLRAPRKKSRAPSMLTGTAVALMFLAAIAWPIWSAMVRPGAEVAGAGERAASEEVSIASAARPEVPAKTQPAGPRAAESSQGVVRAAFESPLREAAARGEPRTALVLPFEQPLRAESLALKPGQRVHPPPGRRATVLVPRGGFTVAAEDVRFENIDFVWNSGAANPPVESQAAAILRLRAAGAEFHGCVFQGSAGGDAGSPAATPCAILWTHPADREQAALSLPSGRVRMDNCLFRRVAAALDCRTLGARGIEWVNSLHLGPGPLLRLDHAPAADEPMRVALAQVTLRDAEAVIDVRCQPTAAPPGEISVEATGCVFAPNAKAALLAFRSARSPDALLARVKWTGQGSLVTPEADIAAWHRPDGQRQTLDDSLISMEGLVRSAVQFAAPAGGPASASRALHWQAPLQSPGAPGVDVEMLR